MPRIGTEGVKQSDCPRTCMRTWVCQSVSPFFSPLYPKNEWIYFTKNDHNYFSRSLVQRLRSASDGHRNLANGIAPLKRFEPHLHNYSPAHEQIFSIVRPRTDRFSRLWVQRLRLQKTFSNIRTDGQRMDGRSDRRPKNTMLSDYYFWRKITNKIVRYILQHFLRIPLRMMLLLAMMFRSNACILRIKVTKRWQYIRCTMKGCRNSFFNSLKNIIFILSVETMVYIQRSWRLTRCSVFLCCLFGSLLRSSNNLFTTSESSRNNKVKKFKVWVPQSVRILIGIVMGRPLNVVITVQFLWLCTHWTIKNVTFYFWL